MDEAYFGGSRKGGGGRRLRNDQGRVLQDSGCWHGRTQGPHQGPDRARPPKSATLLLKLYVSTSSPRAQSSRTNTTVTDGVSRMREGYEHRRINHSAKVYVMGDVHTNTIEGFWSLVTFCRKNEA